jgi:hypothetical protein
VIFIKASKTRSGHRRMDLSRRSVKSTKIREISGNADGIAQVDSSEVRMKDEP